MLKNNVNPDFCKEKKYEKNIGKDFERNKENRGVKPAKKI